MDFVNFAISIGNSLIKINCFYYLVVENSYSKSELNIEDYGYTTNLFLNQSVLIQTFH